MKNIIGLLFLLTGAYLNAETSYWKDEMVRSYVHHSELQRRWALSFLAPYLKKANGDERILDIGCGDGKITADIAKFVPRGYALGIDLSNSMLEWARKQYHIVEYPNLSFQEGSFLHTDISDRFDWIVSFCSFQHCLDQKGALLEISKILKLDGKLLILVPALNNWAWNLAGSKVRAASKWAFYWKDYIPRKFQNEQGYINLLEETGFRIVKVETIQTMDPFIDRCEILDWLEGTFMPVVPKSEIRTFYNEWIEEYLSLDLQSIDLDGVIYARLGYIAIEATLDTP